MNPVLDCLRSHRTIRAFRPDPLPDEEVEAAVRAAQCASTSSHVQAYGLIRIEDAGRRSKLAELTGGQPQVEQAGAFFVVCADQRRHRLVTQRAGEPYEANLETFLVAVVDASLFAQNLVLAFESQGYGICYIGGLRNRLPEVDELLGIPADVFPLYGLCVGVPAQDPPPRPRLAPGAVLFRERYPPDAEILAEVDAHDEAMGAYYALRGKPHYDWSGGIARKFRVPHRTHLLEYYRSKGAVFR